MARVLLIEDMKGIQSSVTAILSNAGHVVTTADNGRQGLEKFGMDKFDLVITDILMPELDGSEVLFALSEDPSCPPMIAISAGDASVRASDALAFARNVADEVLEKPFARNALIEAVNRLTFDRNKG